MDLLSNLNPESRLRSKYHMSTLDAVNAGEVMQSDEAGCLRR